MEAMRRALHERRVREAEEAEELLPVRGNEVEEMIVVNEVSKITVITPAASAFVAVPADLVSTQMSFFGHPPPPFPQSQTLTDPRSIPIRRSKRLSDKESVQSVSTLDNKVEGSSKRGVPSASPSDNEVEGSSEGGVPCTAPSDDMNVDMVAPSIPPARPNPDCTVRSARGGSVASLRTSDEPTDIVVDPFSSDNIFEPSSDDESTEDVFSLSAYEQVESKVNDSDEDNEDNKNNKDNDDEDDKDDKDDEDDEDDEGRDEEITNESNINDAAFNDADNDSDAPVLAELGPKDIMIRVHHTQLSSHLGNMRATELALLNYKEYCGTKSYLVKRAFAANLIKCLDLEGHRFLLKTSNGWMTMSDEETHHKFSIMMTNLNRANQGRVKVKPAKSAVKLNKSK